jgi:hypothetical protein
MEQMLNYCAVYLEFMTNNRAKTGIIADGIIDNYVLVCY